MLGLADLSGTTKLTYKIRWSWVLPKACHAEGRGFESLHVLLLGLMAFFAAQALLKFGKALLLGRTAEFILADLRTRLYDHL